MKIARTSSILSIVGSMDQGDHGGLPWWLSCLDHGALINVDSPGFRFGGSRPDGAQVGSFSSWGTAVLKGFLAHSVYISHSAMSYSKRPSSYMSESALHQRGPLGRAVPSSDKATL